MKRSFNKKKFSGPSDSYNEKIPLFYAQVYLVAKEYLDEIGCPAHDPLEFEQMLKFMISTYRKKEPAVISRTAIRNRVARFVSEKLESRDTKQKLK